jgi:hypothetical protein
MTGPAYVIEGWYIRLAEEAQTTGISGHDVQLLEALQRLMRRHKALGCSPVQVAS